MNQEEIQPITLLRLFARFCLYDIFKAVVVVVFAAVAAVVVVVVVVVVVPSISHRLNF